VRRKTTTLRLEIRLVRLGHVNHRLSRHQVTDYRRLLIINDKGVLGHDSISTLFLVSHLHAPCDNIPPMPRKATQSTSRGGTARARARGGTRGSNRGRGDDPTRGRGQGGTRGSNARGRLVRGKGRGKSAQRQDDSPTPPPALITGRQLTPRMSLALSWNWLILLW
jgi:hypothetical protein